MDYSSAKGIKVKLALLKLKCVTFTTIIKECIVGFWTWSQWNTVNGVSIPAVFRYIFNKSKLLQILTKRKVVIFNTWITNRVWQS